MARANSLPERTNGQRPDQASDPSKATGKGWTSGKAVPQGENLKEKLDRELVELLQEMRVMLPGIQVIFGFLLTVPFTQRFTQLSSLQTATYFSVFISTALATAFLVAPSAYHRLRWRQYDKEHLLRVANKFAIGGLAFFALSMSGIAFIVTDVVIRTSTAVWVAVSIGLIVLILWFGLPILRSAQHDETTR